MLYDSARMPAQLDADTLLLLHDALARMEEGFAQLPAADARQTDPAALRKVLLEAAERMRDNYPYFHPQYAGQMLKPPHAVARLAYALAMWINPNNHALDGGRASSAMEKEAVAGIARMFGWETHLGHLTGGGTMANLEALWIAGELKPGATVLASSQAHYTHSRISSVLKLPFESIAVDRFGRMDVEALERRLQAGGVGTVVATLGTTATGSVDLLPEILNLRDRHGFRLHADCAYGGYYALADNLAPQARAAFDRISEVDSIVIDPHKHGLQPYGCGCVLFRDPAVGAHYRHESPYTYFSSNELHLGEISLECSRPGAAAVALWATQRLLPLERCGEFARMLEDCRAAALALHAEIARDAGFVTAFPPALDIVVWAVRAHSVAESSRRAREIFGKAERAGLYLALAELPADFFGDPWGTGGTVTALRSVLMKPEHRGALPAIVKLLSDSTG
jgi:glutamate/tyrosine decarboxylase-like PLP-dependent enzyme